MKVLIIAIVMIGMHLIGSAIFFGFAIDPSYMLAAPILGIFGWPLIPLEVIGFLFIWLLYKPYSEQGWIRLIKYGSFFGIVGALVASQFIPKEQNHELKYLIAGVFAGFSAAIFSFICTHKIKMAELNRTEPDISADAKSCGTSTEAS